MAERRLVLAFVASFLMTSVTSQQSGQRQNDFFTSVAGAVNGFFNPPINHEHVYLQNNSTVEEDAVAYAGGSATFDEAADSHVIHGYDDDEHDRINRELKEDEIRVMSKGKVSVRKKRFFCNSCYPVQSYGYGGGGGCCGSCGRCGGRGYGGGGGAIAIAIRPVRIRRPCCGGCNVCGRK